MNAKELHEAVELAMTIGDPVGRRDRVHGAIDAHIDALTAKVEALRNHAGADFCLDEECVSDHIDLIERAAVLAILRGEA